MEQAVKTGAAAGMSLSLRCFPTAGEALETCRNSQPGIDAARLSRRSRGMFVRLLCLVASAASLTAAVAANPATADNASAPSIYPTPREVKWGAASVPLQRQAEVRNSPGVDPSALAALKKVVAAGAATGAPVPVFLGQRGQPAVDKFLEGLPKQPGAYRVRIAPGGIVLGGHDAQGAFYAVQTLQQLAAAKGGVLREGTISDWPEVEFRGVVEGFYGTPWSHEKRMRLIRFMGETKLDTYIYGPKDDPYHSSPKWREPYPADQANRIRELAEASRASQVNFFWAIHPGKDIRWNDEDFRNVLKKFEAMYALGVRSFSVFFDDISGEGTRADQQARLLNFLDDEFVKKKRDVTPLVMCPTQYNRAWSNGDYLDVLGRELHPSIRVMWTGDRVIADIDRPSMEWINKRINRHAFIWWNFPVNDYVRNHLLLGPAYGNTADAAPLVGGFVSNPMDRAEASKVALFGVADYAWNPPAYDPQRSWRAGIRFVVPGAADAYETFSAHNSDLGPNGHGYRRKESEEFAPKAEAFLAALRNGQLEGADAVREEMARIAAAPAKIRAGANNNLLLDEINPWLDAFEQLGKAGVAGVDAAKEVQAKRTEQTWPALATAYDALDQMAEINRTKNQNPHQPGVQTGSLVVTPMVREVVELTGTRFLGALSGRAVLRLTAVTSAGGDDTLSKMIDGRDDTFFYRREQQKAGDWFGVELGGFFPVKRVRITQGRKDDDVDIVHTGVLEGLAADGKWQEIAKSGGVRIDVTLNPPREFRQVRLRIERPGVPGGKPDLWTAIREFEINPENAAELRTNVAAFEKLPVRLADGVYSLSPAYEVHTIPPDASLALLLPEESEVASVEADLGVKSPGDAFVIEGQTSGGAWKPFPAEAKDTLLTASPKTPLRAVRLRYTARQPAEAKLARFAVKVAAAAGNPAAVLFDGNLQTSLKLDEKPLEVSVGQLNAKNMAFLLSGAKVPVQVEISGGAGGPTRATVNGPVGRLTLPAGAKTLALRAAPNSGVRLHEIVPLQ